MKKIKKETWGYLILALIGILAFILVLIFLWPEKDKSVQAELIVILICITGYYAIQAQKLVKQQKLSLDEEKNKRVAEFGEKRIEDFLHVLKVELNNMEEKLNRMKTIDSGSNSEIFSVKANFDPITNLLNKRDYLSTKLLNNALWLFKKDVDESWIKQKNWEKPESRAIWRDELLKRVKTIMKLVERERKDIISHIRKTYGYSVDETVEKAEKSKPTEKGE